jgi:uncharacterized protein YacL
VNRIASSEGTYLLSVKIILRLVVAVVFAIVAVIFSELIPPINGINALALQIIITLLTALVGFAVFPDLASWFTKLTFSLYNSAVNRVISEVSNTMVRLQRDTGRMSPMSPTPQVGGISLQRPLILDTSAIIDGRILDIAKTGFISGLVLIPNFILLELQQVSDSSDNLKRSRGRRGFEIINELKKVSGLKVEVWEKEAGGKAVDEKLLQLAKSLHGKIVTTDFNLNRLAGAHAVAVLNVNDLANAVKTMSIPGENMELKVVHIGKDTKQGVGYLPDGTMIVIEDGADQIGKTIKVEVTRVLQGSAGRMIFSKIPRS